MDIQEKIRKRRELNQSMSEKDEFFLIFGKFG